MVTEADPKATALKDKWCKRIDRELKTHKSWRDQAKKSYDPATARLVASVCEAAERRYHHEYGRWYRRNGQ